MKIVTMMIAMLVSLPVFAADFGRAPMPVRPGVVNRDNGCKPAPAPGRDVRPGRDDHGRDNRGERGNRFVRR